MKQDNKKKMIKNFLKELWELGLIKGFFIEENFNNGKSCQKLINLDENFFNKKIENLLFTYNNKNLELNKIYLILDNETAVKLRLRKNFLGIKNFKNKFYINNFNDSKKKKEYLKNIINLFMYIIKNRWMGKDLLILEEECKKSKSKFNEKIFEKNIAEKIKKLKLSNINIKYNYKSEDPKIEIKILPIKKTKQVEKFLDEVKDFSEYLKIYKKELKSKKNILINFSFEIKYDF